MHRSIRSVRTLVATSLILGAAGAMSSPGLVSRAAAQQPYCDQAYCYATTPVPVWGTAPAGMTTPLYRLYNATNGDHLYTTSAAERDAAILNAGYVSEGVAARVSATAQTGLMPIYRLYSAALGNHFYTTNAAERDQAVASIGYVSEGIAAYVSVTAQAGLAPLYRLYSAALGNHFYTTSESERDAAVRTHGFVAEGIAAYVVPVTP